MWAAVGGSDVQVIVSELGFRIRLMKAFWMEVVSGRETIDGRV